MKKIQLFAKRLTFYVVASILAHPLVAQPLEDADLIEEHVYGELPSNTSLMVRNAYVLDYDSARKAPIWVAYHLTEEYRLTPKRTGKWKTYRNDPDLNDEPKETDYSGVYYDPIRNYARGHIAPFMICGGDRDGDNAVLDRDRDGKIEEGEDEGTNRFRDQLP